MDSFYLDLNKIENKRIRNLIVKQLKLISQSSVFNKLLPFFYGIGSIGLLYICLFIQTRHAVYSCRFATTTGSVPFATSAEPVRRPTSGESSGPSSTSGPSRGSHPAGTTFAFNPEPRGNTSTEFVRRSVSARSAGSSGHVSNTPTAASSNTPSATSSQTSDTTKNVAFVSFKPPEHSMFVGNEEAEETFLQAKFFNRRNRGFMALVKKIPKKLELVNCFDLLNVESRSTASTEVPPAESSVTFKTTKQIVKGKRYKRKLLPFLTTTADPFDSLFIEDSEEKVGRPIKYLGEHIIRKEFKPDAIKNFNLKNKYAYFIPEWNSNSKKLTYDRYTLIGNELDATGSRELSTALKNFVDTKKVDTKTKKQIKVHGYKFVPHTFDHLTLDEMQSAINLNRVPRNGMGDQSIGPALTKSANQIMGKTNIKLVQPLIDEGKTIFSTDSNLTVHNLIERWSKLHKLDGLNRLDDKVNRKYQEIKKEVYYRIQQKNPVTWANLSEDERFNKGLTALKTRLCIELSKDNSILIDSALRYIIDETYKESTKYTLQQYSNWAKKTHLLPEQTNGYYFACKLVNEAHKEIYEKVLLTAYDLSKVKISSELLSSPKQKFSIEFKKQVERTQALHDIVYQMKKSWPNDSQLHYVLDEKIVDIQRINRDLLEEAKLIFEQMDRAEQQKQLKFFNKKGEVKEVDFSKYKTEYINELDEFEKMMSKNDLASTDKSPEEIFDKLFQQNNNLNLDRGLKSKDESENSPRFIKPLPLEEVEAYLDFDAVAELEKLKSLEKSENFSDRLKMDPTKPGPSSAVGPPSAVGFSSADPYI